MVCPGNHEYAYNFTVYNERFSMPGLINSHDNPSGTNMFHSFDYANIHFTAITTEPSARYLKKGTIQFEWLNRDLDIADQRRLAGEIDWIIVFGHKPLYCSYNWTDCCGQCNQTSYSPDWDKGATSYELRSAFEELLHKYKVDMYLAGHVHAYERMFPVYDERIDPQTTYEYVNPKYPVHIVSGAAGCVETVPTPVDPINFLPPQNAVRLGKFGFGKMEVFGSKQIHWQFIGANSTYVGEILDEFWITKDNSSIVT